MEIKIAHFLKVFKQMIEKHYEALFRSFVSRETIELLLYDIPIKNMDFKPKFEKENFLALLVSNFNVFY